MPTTIQFLIDKFELPSSNVVKWKEKILTEEEGVYIVSRSKNPASLKVKQSKIPISGDIIEQWIAKVKGFELDKSLTFDSSKVIERITQFWMPDENILYIGKAPVRRNGKGIGNRVKEFYNTELGDKRPHAGGHWIKVLANLDNLYLHYIICQNSGEIEFSLLECFIENVSGKSKLLLRDKELMLPFGNLELKKGLIKKHGLGKMKL